ncbi:MAG: segregation/condensation protein A [Bacilli bacterium]|nr:segregation/condensation protein A [Bacilli bacterium]
MDISLDNFQGPMDLLLHLVKKKEMDIMNIKIEIIIDEYLNYINSFEKMNLNVASAYLVMASELLEIKSRMLLPHEDNDEELNDLKENLINRIIEYEKYKELVPTFRELEKERLNYKTKSPTSILEYKQEQLISDLTMDTLVKAYQNFLIRIEEEKPISTKITKKEISIESQILRIKEKFKTGKRFQFDELFEKRTRPYVVATFLALLEMVRYGEIKIYQEDSFGTILCEAGDVK